MAKTVVEQLGELKKQFLGEMKKKCKKKAKPMMEQKIEVVKEEKVNEDYSYESPYDWEEIKAEAIKDLTEEQRAEFDDLDEYDQDRVAFILHDNRGDWDEAIENYEDVMFYEGDTPADVVQNMYENDPETFSKDFLMNHVDWVSVAREFEIGDNFTYTDIGAFQRF